MALIRRRESTSPSGARRWDPFEVMQEMMRWDPFRELIPAWGDNEAVFMPAFDVKETKNGYVFKADVPGLTEDNLELSVLGNQLTISGQRTEEKRDESDRVYTYERSFGSFTRSFTLPEGADTDHVEAELKDGVLTVTVAKKEGAERRRIPLFGKKRPEIKA